MGRWVSLLALLLCEQSAFSGTINVPGDYSTIQAAVNAAITADVIVVASGTYPEQVRIDGKNLTLQGAGIGQSIIEAVPLVSRTTYSITQWNATVRSIDAMVGVTEAGAVDISGFTFDGLALGPDNFYGAHYFNSDGSVTDCEFVDITNAAGTGSQRVVSLAATHGAAGSCAIDFSSNEVPTFQKVGVLLMGPSATGTIDNNTIVGGGITTVAQNGIQIGYGAAATLTGNDVSMVAYPGDDWAGSGILLFECGDVTVSGGSVTGSEVAIGHSQWNWIYTPLATPTIVVDGVALDENQWAISTHLGGDGADLNLEVMNCTINNSTYAAIELWGSDIDPWGGGYYAGWVNGALNVNIHGNWFTGSGIGVEEYIELATGNTVVCNANGNSLLSYDEVSGFSFYNNFTNMVDATGSHWIYSETQDPKVSSASSQQRRLRFPALAEGTLPSEQLVSRYLGREKSLSPPEGVSANVDYSPWWGDDYISDDHSGPWSWHVDNSNGSTVQEGVDAAAAGDSLFVEAGTYEEQIVIDKQLALGGSLSGSGGGGVSPQGIETIITAPPVLTEQFTTGGPNYPIIFVNNATVHISDIRVDGLHRGNANYRFTGIGFWNGGGSVTNVEITGVRDDPFSGSQHGVGLYAFNNTGGPYSLDIDLVSVTDFQKGGIVLGGGGLTASVTNSVVIGAGATDITAQNGIQIGFGASGTIIGSIIFDIAYTADQWGASGILFYEAANGAVSGATTVIGSQAAIVFHETSGSVDGGIVIPTGTNNEEGVSIRDYGNLKTSSVSYPIPAASPLEDQWPGPFNKSKVPTMVTVSNVTLAGIGTEGSYGCATWGLGEWVYTTLIDSDIQGWDVGVVAYDDGVAPSVNASHNRIYGNTYGFWTNTSFGQLAERNYWGSNHGPTHAANPNGDGDEVTDWIDYEPWCNYDFSICDIMISCCIGRVGDANGIGGDEPTIGDISSMIDMLFITSTPVACMPEADVNQSGGYNPVQENVTIGDISTLIDYLFITGPSLGLPDCL